MINDKKAVNRLKQRNGQAEINNSVYGKVPPQARELEEAVLGAIMLEKGVFDAVAEILKPECFYVDAHQRIFKAMQGLANKSQPIDILTVVEELRFHEELEVVGGPYFVTKLTNSVVSSANIEAHIHIIKERFVKRELIKIGGELVTDAYENSTNANELIESAQSKIYTVSTDSHTKDFKRIDTALVNAFQYIESIRHQELGITGVPSGLKPIDEVTCGWQNTDLIVLAARPSVGKTAFALNIARNAALHPIKPTPVCVFSLEMSERQLTQRIMSTESGISLSRIMNGRLDEDHMKDLYEKGGVKLSNAPIYIDDSAGINMNMLRSKARRLKTNHNVGLIIIDYLQLMTGDSNNSSNREREIAKISRELKNIAKDLEIPIIALSQLSREVEKRPKGQKVPMLSDLRESGAIEQDADLVMFLYRPPEDEVKEDPELKGKGVLRIAKHRNGQLGDIVLNFDGDTQRWTETEKDPF